MKKLILLLSVIAMIATSCGQKDAFTVTGTLPNGEYDGQLVFLQTMDSTWNTRALVTIDTAEVRDGRFEFKGLALQGPTIHYIQLDQAPDFLQRPQMVIVEPGKINIKMDTISTVGGTKINDAFQVYGDKASAFFKEMNAMYAQVMADTANTALKSEFDSKVESGQKELNIALFDFVKSNISNQVGAFFFAMSSYNLELDQLNGLMAELKPEYKSMERFTKLAERLERMNATAVGKLFTDVKSLTPEGKEIALSDYVGKGKVVLIDFWASWCGPCIQEMPNVKKAYEQYKDKGFEIVGISLDDNADAWKESIKELGITWPQMSDLKAWDSEAAKLYGVSGIPHTILLDKEGKILEKNLRGEKISEKLGELLN